MKPFAIYHLCREAFSFHQQQLTEVIVKAANPDMVFLLGATLHRKRCESIFNELAPLMPAYIRLHAPDPSAKPC